MPLRLRNAGRWSVGEENEEGLVWHWRWQPPPPANTGPPPGPGLGLCAHGRPPSGCECSAEQRLWARVGRAVCESIRSFTATARVSAERRTRGQAAAQAGHGTCERCFTASLHCHCCSLHTRGYALASLTHNTLGFPWTFAFAPDLPALLVLTRPRIALLTCLFPCPLSSCSWPSFPPV